MVVSQQHAIPTAATLFKTIDTLNEKEQLSIIVRLKDSLKSQPKQALSVLKIMASQSKPKITVLHSQVEFLTSIFQDADLDHLIADSLKVLELLINSNTKIATSILENFLEPYILLNAFDPKANVGVESDFSEWDNDDIPNTPIQRYEWKVQYQSLKCIIVLCKQVSKHMLPYWPKLLSSDSKSSRNVCRLAQSHPSKMVRKVCFELLQVMFDDCNGRYLSMASSDTKPTSFTSLSHSLSEILSVSNQYIIECFENDGDHVMLMKLYPAVCAMIRNSPLVKLREDYVQLWFHVLYDRINSKRLVVDEKCCLLNAFSQLVLHFVQGRHDLLLQRTISMLKEQIDHKSTSMTLKCFILQLIRSICQNYALVVWKDIEFYDLIMQEARFSKFKEMNLCYVQLVEQLAVGDLFDFLDVEWWINSLEHASVFFSNDFVKLRVHSCQLLGLVPKTVITQLPSRLIAFLKVSIVCLLRDENEEVRVAASSVLGSHWSELIFDDLIFLDEILNQLGINMVDNTSKVRAKSACAAGNILTIVKEHDLILQEDILLLIFNQSVKGLGEHEKIKVHALRCLGLVVQMLPQNSILSLRAQLDAIVDSLCKSLFTGTFKARWNTSHCFKMFLSNSNFPIGGSTSYTQKIFDALQRATVESLNFKVRTSAIHALSTPTLISKYQTLKSDGQTTIKNCIESCVKSIETVDIALERSSHDERLYLDQFFAAIRGAIIHFKEIFLTIGNDWNVEYIKLEQRAKELESLVKNPPVTTIKND